MKVTLSGKVKNLSQEDKMQHKLWKLNYLYRVWYGAIPGLPDDMVVIGKIQDIFNSLFSDDSEHQLGTIYNENKQIIGYNDLENYLDAYTGLIGTERFRIFREYKNKEDWYTEAERQELYEEYSELRQKNWKLEREGKPKDETVTRYDQLCSLEVLLKNVDNNSLGFGVDTIRMQSYGITIGLAIVERTEDCYNPFTKRKMETRFKNIQDLLRRTELPQPPSNKALPRAKVVSEQAYEKFLADCPSYMSEYKHKLVEKEKLYVWPNSNSEEGEE